MLQDTLMREILDTDSGMSTVVRAIKLVQQLRAEGLPAAAAVQPLSSFTVAQRDFLQRRLRHVADQHVEAVCTVQAMKVPLLNDGHLAPCRLRSWTCSKRCRLPHSRKDEPVLLHAE
jgi:hypothetical protein